MSRLLHIAEREARKIHTKHEQLNSTEDVNVYLDWSRQDGKEKLQLLTIIKDLPKRIAKDLCTHEEKKMINNGGFIQ